MRLLIKAMSSVSALLWVASILVVCLMHISMAHYGMEFLDSINWI